MGWPPHCVYTAAPHCQAKLTLSVSVAKVAVQGTLRGVVAGLPVATADVRVYSRPDRKTVPCVHAGTVVCQLLPVNTVLGVTDPGTKLMTPSGMGTVMPLKLTLWPVTETMTGWLVAVAAAQMEASGTSLLLSQRQSPAGMATSMNCCGTLCVVGVSPSVHPAWHIQGSAGETLIVIGLKENAGDRDLRDGSIGRRHPTTKP